jgi:DNA modification methylase
MHKYWGKKPANDLNKLIEEYSNKGDTVLDPFSGYGVFCCEAYLLGRNVISNDLNPSANFITDQLLERNINVSKIKKQWKTIKEKFTPFVNSWYEFHYKDEKIIPSAILRDNNDIPIMLKFKRNGDKKSTEITVDQKSALAFIEFEKSQEITDWYPTDSLIENSRISAKKGMTIADLFTKRTLACHARLLSLIESHSSGKELQLLKLAFTANLANCSKLVPPIKSRGPMAPGAWMTGFYIGDTYIENNVLQYFENRFNKTIKGKEDYLSFFESNCDLFSKQEKKSTYSITRDDAKHLSVPSESVDYIFTDPPYGDAVPYFEQSIIWNTWLKLDPDYDNEIVITDSKERKKGAIEFELEIEEAFSEIRRVLKDGGYFSLTYHSLSGLEWKAITNACIKNGFELVDFQWLVQKSFTPRQINRLKSIKGDVLVTFQKVPSIQSKHLTNKEVETLFLEKVKDWITVAPLDTNEIFLKIMKMIFEEKIIIKEIDLLKILTANFKFTENQKWILNDELELC